MVSIDALPVEIEGDALVPRFLAESDDPWIGRLLEEYARFAGQPRKKLDEHMRAGLPFDAPARKLALARYALGKLWRVETVAVVRPATARRVVFCAAASRARSRRAAIDHAAEELEVSPVDLEAALLADLPGERRMLPPTEEITLTELRLRANLVLVQRLLERSMQVRLQLYGNARPVVRHAKLKGLICNVVGDSASQSIRLEISGPLSLFKRTLVYGRALGELPAQLAWCDRFYLEADVLLGAGPARLILATGAPIFPARRSKRFDSRLEERFAKELGRATSDWDIIREPEPIPIARSLIFPDFALVRRRPPHERWFVEIVGFWTADYLEHKLATLRLAGLERLILCVDKKRGCSERELPAGAHLVEYERKVDVHEVLRILEGAAAA